MGEKAFKQPTLTAERHGNERKDYGFSLRIGTMARPFVIPNAKIFVT